MLGRWGSLLSVGLVALAAPIASAQFQGSAPKDLVPTMPPAIVMPQAAPLSPPQYSPLPPVAVYTQPMACAEPMPPAHFTPFMLGDFIGPVANLFSDVKIAENESPRPTDRVYYSFNYYKNLDQAESLDPRRSFHNVDLYQNVLGIEKTFFDQRVSLGLRVPFYTMDADGKDFQATDANGVTSIQHGTGFSETEFGNIAAIVKAVIWEDKENGNLISGGATLSFPTASSIRLNVGQSLLAYMQPYAGFILQRGDLFVQGFSSITLPLARPESILMFNDIGVGYYVYHDRGGLLRGVAPTAELHVATPLRQADRSVLDFGVFDDIRLHDVVDVTVGATFEFSGGASLGVGVVSPLTGPKPFDIEAIAQLNYRF